jgi:Methyltransferase domain
MTDEGANSRPVNPNKAKARAAKEEKRRAKAAKAETRAKAPGKKAKKERPKPPILQRKAVRGRLRAVRRRWKYTRRGVRRIYNRRYRFTYKRTIQRVPSRDELPALLNARGLVGRGAEIGVKQGKYSEELLSNWHGSELVSIDPWLSADPDEYVDRSNVSQDRFNEFYEETRERLADYGSRSTIWRMTSVEAAAKVPDQSFDFVYIDARHDYESVKEDLEAWCSKVRPGGILAGHDYVDGDLPEGEFYVKSAVDEFFGARKIPVHGTEGPSAVESFPTWIVEVPEGGVMPTAQRTDVEVAPERSPA